MSKTLHVSISNRVATYSQRDGSIICGNSDYQIKFAFDAEWSSHQTKTARFLFDESAVDVLFDGDTVTVPILRNVLALTVGVFAGNLQTTTPALIPCVKSILCDDGLPPDPEPDVYTQMMETLNRYEDATTRMEEISSEVTEFMENSAEQIAKIEADSSAFVEESTERMDKMETDVSDFISESTEKINGLESDVADLQYTLNPLTITKFENNVKNARIGQTVTDITFSWAFNQTPKSVTLCNKDGYTITSHAVDSEGTTLSEQSVTNDTKWKLKATDKRDKAVTKETSITFLHGVYYGVGAPRDSYDSEFVKGLSVEWRTNKKPSVALSPNKEHIYYCLPTWMGACNFSVGVLPGGFELADTIMFTNEYGYEQAYYIYKSVELLEGTAIKVNIS